MKTVANKQQVVKNQKGMTLIELMAVVVILAIVATIAGVAVVNASAKARESADTATISVIKDAAQRLLLDDDAKGKDFADKQEVTITAANLLSNANHGPYLIEVPEDSAGEKFEKLTVQIVTIDLTNPSGVKWVFFNTQENDTGTFAPNAKNKK